MKRTEIISTRHEIHGIDTLRGIAALLVFLYHFWALAWRAPTAPDAFKAGYMGVDIFFVLSGFLLYQSLHFSKSGIKNFYKRRVLRIAPIYYFSLIFLLIFNTQSSFFTYEGILDIVKHLTFTHVFWESSNSTINPVLWTLSLEVFFYALLPILFLLGARKVWRVVGIAIVMIATTWIYKDWLFHAYYSTWTSAQQLMYSRQFLGKLDQFGVGILTALMYIRLGSTHSIRHQWLSFAGLVASIGFFYYLLVVSSHLGAQLRSSEILNMTWGTVVALSVSMVIIFLLHTFPLVKKIASNKLTSAVGVISYSMYIWHYTIIEKVALRGYSVTGAFLVSLSLTLLVSAITYFFVERPFLRLGHKKSKK